MVIRWTKPSNSSSCHHPARLALPACLPTSWATLCSSVHPPARQACHDVQRCPLHLLFPLPGWPSPPPLLSSQFPGGQVPNYSWALQALRYFPPGHLSRFLVYLRSHGNSLQTHTAAHQASLSFTISRSLLKLMSIESVMPSNHLILCRPLLLLLSVFPSIRGLFQLVGSSHQVVKVLEFLLQHQSFQ